MKKLKVLKVRCPNCGFIETGEIGSIAFFGYPCNKCEKAYMKIELIKEVEE